MSIAEHTVVVISRVVIVVTFIKKLKVNSEIFFESTLSLASTEPNSIYLQKDPFETMRPTDQQKIKNFLEKKDEEKSESMDHHHYESTAGNLSIPSDATKPPVSVPQPTPTRGRPKGSTNAAKSLAAAAAAAAAAGLNAPVPGPLPTDQSSQRKMNPPKVKIDKSSKSGSSKSCKSPNDKTGPALNVRVRQSPVMEEIFLFLFDFV